MPIIQTFEPNEKGRDFVIGDLHGALPCLENLMNHLEFDTMVDRMFSVGDLVDRGIDSFGCLSRLRDPWFHPVRANHEWMMYECFFGGYSGPYWFRNGGDWGFEAFNVYTALEARANGRAVQMPVITDEDVEIIELAKMIEDLPFLITVNTKSGKKFHIIHAELPPGYIITDSELSSPGKVEEYATKQTSDGDVFLWGRYKFMDFYKKDLSNRGKIIRTVEQFGKQMFPPDGLSHIISGHTIMRQPFTLLGQTNIDTGAYYSLPSPFSESPAWAGLTCIELDTWTFYKATPTSVEVVEPFVINKDDLFKEKK